MKIKEFTAAQFLKFYETRLSDKRMRKGSGGYTALCPFHDDRNPSLSINVEIGVWRCHSCNVGGGILDFEMKFASCDKETAMAHIAEIVGVQQLNLGRQPEAVYSYTDAFGKELFQVVRYPGKRFTQRRRDDKGNWVYETASIKMVLYHLPEVMTSTNVIVVEGEKDADNLEMALAGKVGNVAVTTSPRGAGKWKDEYSVFFAGKQVLILPDNDEPGRKHANLVATSVYRYAAGVKVVSLLELKEHGDVSDFLNDHPVEEVLSVAKATAWWKPVEPDSSLFMTVSQFQEKAVDNVCWLLEGVIQCGANGMIIARPKSGKSFAVADLALALASGQKWLEFYVPKRAHVALVSREDVASLTQWRTMKLMKHRGLTREELDGWLYINAKGLKPRILLDYPEDVAALIADLKRYKTEFLILDVMRVLHSKEENDNTEMQKVIDTLNKIQSDTGASICLIHHDNKREEATLTERARGASAIAGWAEFICGIRVMEEENWTREFACELKAAMAPDKFYWRIVDTADNGIDLARVVWEPPKRGDRRRTADQSSKDLEFPPED